MSCCGMAGWVDLVFVISAASGARADLRVPSEPDPPSANRNPRVASASFLSSTPRPRIFLEPCRDFHSTTVGHNLAAQGKAQLPPTFPAGAQGDPTVHI